METITFILGLVLGLLLPLILERHLKKKKNHNQKAEEYQPPQNLNHYTPDLIEEWQTGIIKGSDDDDE